MGPIDFARLRKELDGRRIGILLKISSGRGPCPIHKSEARSRSFSFDPSQYGMFQCFKCGARGNGLDLYAAMTKQPLHPAAIDLCEKLGIDVPWLPKRVRQPYGYRF